MSRFGKRVSAVEAAVLKSMTDEQLEAICAGEPEIDLSDFSIAELEALIGDYASDALVQRFIERREAAEPVGSRQQFLRALPRFE
jgi:hypothetical protein